MEQVAIELDLNLPTVELKIIVKGVSKFSILLSDSANLRSSYVITCSNRTSQRL